MQWESVIGLEVHVQLATDSKLFSGSRNQFGDQPNQNACPIDLGFPGTLPVINQQAVAMAIKIGVALNGTIAQSSSFDRKNYFYPDLPKGYQVTQMETPIFSGGTVSFEVAGQQHTIQLHHAHLEEDAGKSVHGLFSGYSGIDLNRAGTPLLEIVTEPDFRTAAQACAFLKKIHTLVQYLQVSDGNMAQGSLRCDANVSVRPQGQSTLGTRTEIKNLNSFRFIEQAIQHEVQRHIFVLESGGCITQETRLFDPDRNETRPMRNKEDANDYRYFPEPDLLPMIIETNMIDSIKQSMPELEDAKKMRFMQAFALNNYDASLLTSDINLASYFEQVLNFTAAQNAKTVANWILTELLGALKKYDLSLDKNPIMPQQLAQLVERITTQIISNTMAKTILETLLTSPSDQPNQVDKIIEQQGLKQVSNTDELTALIANVLDENPNQVQAYLAATAEKQAKMTGFFIGQLMKKTKGKANPQVLQTLLKQNLQLLSTQQQ